MPFGLTGAPTTFCKMVAKALEYMIDDELVVWMDDIGIVDDDFDRKLGKMRKFFGKCQEKGLSLAPAKCKLFQSKTVFGGVTISTVGITPNPDKVAVVLDWPEPQTSHELLRFLGLTGFFCRHIRGYATIAQPLSDLTWDIKVEKPRPGWKTQKGAYRWALQATSITDKWGEEQKKAFLTLKVAVTSEPVLKLPQYGGRVFRIVTDGSKKGFGRILCQEFESTDDQGKVRKRWHPLAFCSKWTSLSKEKYEPFMLEFATLKFALDNFVPMIYRSPIEIETDCQALHDVLLNKKQSTTHAQWEESITCRNIVDIWHRPGITNVVADAISRKWSEVRGPSTGKDGADWTVRPDWEASKGIVNDIMLVGDRMDREVEVHAEMRERFKEDPWLSEVVEALTDSNLGDICTRRRAKHRALNFMIEDGKLWRVRTKGKDWTAWVECVPRAEGCQLASQTHAENGHFSWDQTKLRLHDNWFWPGMDRDT